MNVHRVTQSKCRINNLARRRGPVRRRTVERRGDVWGWGGDSAESPQWPDEHAKNNQRHFDNKPLGKKNKKRERQRVGLGFVD